MQNDKSTELVRNKMEGLNALESGIVFGKEDAWEKLQQRMERKPAMVIPMKRIAAVAAVLLLIVSIFLVYNRPAKVVSIVATKPLHAPGKGAAVQPQVPMPQKDAAAIVIATKAKNYKMVVSQGKERPQPQSAPVTSAVSGSERLVATTNTTPQPEPQPQSAKKMRVVHVSELSGGANEEPAATTNAMYTSVDITKLPVVHINDVIHEEREVENLRKENRLGAEHPFHLWHGPNRAVDNDNSNDNNAGYRLNGRQKFKVNYE